MVRTIVFCFLSVFAMGQERTMGIFVNQEEAFNGYTLLGNSVRTYLIDNCGEVVNTWLSDYKTGHAIHLLENGNLLRAGQVDGDFQAGGRGGVIELFNWEGQRLWQYFHSDSLEWSHHDIALLPNGNFIFSVWVRHSEEEAKSLGRLQDGELWSEKIVEMSLDEQLNEKIVWEWDSWDHLIQDVDSSLANFGVISENPGRIDINYESSIGGENKNFQHVNSLDYNASFDQILFSSRFLSEVMVIDHSTNTLEASGSVGGNYGKGGNILYRYGNPQVYDYGDENDRKLNGQHNAQWIGDSMFIVFNNLYLPGEQSRVQVFRNPADSEGVYEFSEGGFGNDSIIWSYTDTSFFSNILSSAQLLPNGNVLTCLGKTGRFVEVNADKKIVWEYINPVNRNSGPLTQGSNPTLNTMFKIRRYAPDYPAFEGKDLTPQGPIELQPLPSVCSITSTVSESESRNSLLITFDKPYLYVKNEEEPIDYELYNIQGVLVQIGILQQGLNEWSSHFLVPGIYIVKTKKEVQKFSVY